VRPRASIVVKQSENLPRATIPTPPLHPQLSINSHEKKAEISLAEAAGKRAMLLVTEMTLFNAKHLIES